MRYNIIGKNIDVWDKTKEMVEKKMDRIAKLFPADTEATITLSLEKQVATVEVTIPMNKRYARAEVHDADMTAAMDKTVDIRAQSDRRCRSFSYKPHLPRLSPHRGIQRSYALPIPFP